MEQRNSLKWVMSSGSEAVLVRLFIRVTENGDRRTATIDELVTAAREYTTDHEQFADQFRVTWTRL